MSPRLIPPAVRCFQRYDSDSRASRAASFRLHHVERTAVGEFFYTHPWIPNRAFRTAKAAVDAARGSMALFSEAA